MQAPGASLDEIDKGQSGCAACAQFRKTDSLGPEARNPGQRDRAPHTDYLSGMHAACVKHPVSGRKNLRLNFTTLQDELRHQQPCGVANF